MPDTSLGITYPSSTDHTRMWEHFQTLAQDIDNLITQGRISGSRIATGTVAAGSADSASVTTTEISIASVTANLTTGRTYRVRYATRIGTSVAGTLALVRVREDSVAGTEMIGDNVYLGSSGSAGNPAVMEGEYTAVATGAKTFHLTITRAGGTGDVRRESSFMPTYIYVDYIRE